MDAAVPGINNVTSHIRPYAFMAWTWKMAANVVGSSGLVNSVEALDYIARQETYYEWANSLAGKPFRGAAALRKALPHNNSTESFPFKGERWEEFKRNRLGFMAPTEYGPSIKALGVLKQVEGGMFRTCSEFEEAIGFIDHAVKTPLQRGFSLVNRVTSYGARCDPSRTPFRSTSPAAQNATPSGCYSMTLRKGLRLLLSGDGDG
jgi:hypothetical protein